VGKESLKIGLSVEKENVITVCGTLARNTLTFAQVFFSSLAQVYMSSKIRKIFKSKNYLFNVCQSTQ